MPLVMGTAGHIDHGKTTLIRALTGTDCDRLEEEKRRGITIELGFAKLLLPPLPGREQRFLSVVDVPGHERFVRTMVAGASGVDLLLLVVAADEGVMPQTREHLEICSLLGIRSGVVALTKADCVDEELLALAHEDVTAFLGGTVLEGVPVIPVSARTGQGLEGLMAALSSLEDSITPVRSHDIFRLPVDRAFIIKGYGTVVTGTMISGTISVGDTVRLYPGGPDSKVRGLQSHGAVVETALAGRRTAVNIPDIAVEEIRKGEVLSRPGMLFPSLRWIVELTCLPSSPRALRHRSEAHFHHGSYEMQAHFFLADRDRLQPGESCLCEVRFAEPMAAVYGDCCVVRSFSPLRTIAGGMVLNPLGVDMHRRGSGFAERCAMLSSLAPKGDFPLLPDEERVFIQMLCTKGAEKGLSFSLLRILTSLDSRSLEKALGTLSGRQCVFCFDKEHRLFLAEPFFTRFATSCKEAVLAFHQRFSEKQGIRRSELMSGWGRALAPKLAHLVIERMVKQGILVTKGEFLRLPAHSATFNKKQAPLSKALLAAHKNAGLAPPNLNELLALLGAEKKEAAPILAALRASGQLVRVTESMWYAAEHLQEVENMVRVWFETHKTLDITGLRSVTGLSRKYLVALLEYFDTQKITMRVGDARMPRKK